MDNRRRHDRKPVRADDIRGEFVLVAGNSRYTFSEVEDVSISGLGILLPVCLHVNDQVVLNYRDEDLFIETRGFVAWVRERPATPSGLRYRTGVRFSREDVHSNILFFMALREYIDRFSEAS